MCCSHAPTFVETITEVNNWLVQPENAQEILFVKLESYTNNRSRALSAQIASVFNVSLVYSAAERAADLAWPTLTTLLQRGKQVAFFSANDPSQYVHTLNETTVDPEDLAGGQCPVINAPAGFRRAQGGL